MKHKGILKTKIMFALSGACELTAQELANMCTIAETVDSCPNTRDLIRELIADGFLIGSSSTGYKMLTSGKEVQQYLNALLRRQLGISRRIQAVYDAAVKSGVL